MAMTVPELPEPSAHMAMAVLDPANEVPCPYQHISAIPSPLPTTPHMEVINLNEPTARALFTRKMGTGTGIMSLADSGASHILLQASAANVLQQVEYSRENDPLFAEFKAANHGVLTAIGRGILSISGLAVMAFIFADCDLANNLLGLVPFANLGCTGVFQPRTFMIYKEGDPTPILAGTRTSLDSLWQVPLHRDLGCVTDGITPPSGTPGIYFEANAVSIQDNATYVRFVHASMGYPAPSTFLRAVTSGFITGPNQFPRLTPKMVRKHLPNVMATAKGHLDRTPSGVPHAQSDAVSARRRHHATKTRDAAARLVQKYELTRRRHHVMKTRDAAARLG
jgi:hypothetical protein